MTRNQILLALLAIGIAGYVWYKKESIINPDSIYQVESEVHPLFNTKDVLPLIIVIHPNREKPSGMKSYLKDMELGARIAYLRGPFKDLIGYRWWEDKAALATKNAQLRTLSKDIAEGALLLTAKYPTKGEPIILGYKEGASLAYSIAASYPYNFSAIFAVNGALEKELLPEDPYKELETKLYAMHGTYNTKVTLKDAQATASFIYRGLRNTYFLKWEGGDEFPNDFVGPYLKNHINSLR